MANSEPGFNVPDDLLYTKNHEWARVEDGTVEIGITDFAQNALGDITYVELPEEGDNYKKDAVLGTVDSLKTVAEIYAPVGGTIEAVNTELPNEAELINDDPYGQGWMVKIEINDEKELEGLMPAADYLKFISKKSRQKK